MVLVSGGEISYRDEDNHDGDNDADNEDAYDHRYYNEDRVSNTRGCQ